MMRQEIFCSQTTTDGKNRRREGGQKRRSERKAMEGLTRFLRPKIEEEAQTSRD